MLCLNFQVTLVIANPQRNYSGFDPNDLTAEEISSLTDTIINTYELGKQYTTLLYCHDFLFILQCDKWGLAIGWGMQFICYCGDNNPRYFTLHYLHFYAKNPSNAHITKC